MIDIETYAPKSGRVLKEDNTVVNMAELATAENLFPKKVTVATAGTLVQLADLAVESVVIKADPTNTGDILIHASGTPAAGEEYLLEAGDTVAFVIDNLNKIFIDATVNGESIYRLGIK